jgi:hypothetical protein
MIKTLFYLTHQLFVFLTLMKIPLKFISAILKDTVSTNLNLNILESKETLSDLLSGGENSLNVLLN